MDTEHQPDFGGDMTQVRSRKDDKFQVYWKIMSFSIVKVLCITTPVQSYCYYCSYFMTL